MMSRCRAQGNLRGETRRLCGDSSAIGNFASRAALQRLGEFAEKRAIGAARPIRRRRKLTARSVDIRAIAVLERRSAIVMVVRKRAARGACPPQLFDLVHLRHAASGTFFESCRRRTLPRRGALIATFQRFFIGTARSSPAHCRVRRYARTRTRYFPAVARAASRSLDRRSSPGSFSVDPSALPAISIRPHRSAAPPLQRAVEQNLCENHPGCSSPRPVVTRDLLTHARSDRRAKIFRPPVHPPAPQPLGSL